MLKLASLITLFFFAGAALAQSTPSVTRSDTPAVTPSQTPAVTPSQTPPAVGGISQCQNMIGAERDKCLQEAQRPNRGTAGTGGTHAAGSTGTGAGTTGSQNTAPAGSIR